MKKETLQKRIEKNLYTKGGKLAKKYASLRRIDSDFSRTERQRKILSAFQQELYKLALSAPRRAGDHHQYSLFADFSQNFTAFRNVVSLIKARPRRRPRLLRRHPRRRSRPRPYSRPRRRRRRSRRFR